jgi:hypothetical protein
MALEASRCNRMTQGNRHFDSEALLSSISCNHHLFLKMGHLQPLFNLFSSFQTVEILKNFAPSWDRTLIFGVESQNADH